ncbi:hypothetical protein ACLKA6_009720 [Drosophila palustris]
MMLNGKDYELLRNLNMLTDDTLLSRLDMLQIARAKAKTNIAISHEINARKYNLRGATISCVGNEAASQLQAHPKAQKCSGRIRTANHTECAVVGRLIADITYRGITKPVDFYIIPSLKQDVYLGIDFWQDFGLLKQIIQNPDEVNELDVGREDDDEDPPKPFMLLCDASLHGLGCVLAQQDEDGAELPIAYMSVKLTKAQRNSVTELECLAVIKGIQKFRAYIEGQF